MSGVFVREVGSDKYPGDEFITSVLKHETRNLCFAGKPTIPDDAWIFFKVRAGTQLTGSEDTCRFCAVAVKVHGEARLDGDGDRCDWQGDAGDRSDSDEDGAEPEQRQLWYAIKEVVQFAPVRCSYRLRSAVGRPVVTYALPEGDEATALARAADNGRPVETYEARLARQDAARQTFVDKYGLVQKETKRLKTDLGKGTRAEERQRRREVKRAAKQVPVPFCSPRNHARPGDSCCEKLACSQRYEVTASATKGLIPLTAFRTKFLALSEDERRHFLAQRHRTDRKGERTWMLESPTAIQEIVIQDKAIAIDVHGIETTPVCADFLCYALGVSRNKLAQPTVQSPHFQTKMPGRMDAQREHGGKSVLVCFWLLQLAAFYLHDPVHAQIILPFADKKTVYDMYLEDTREDGEDRRMYAPDGPCSRSTFFRAWASTAATMLIKVRKTLRFSLCDKCVEFIETRQKRLSKQEHEALKAKEHEHHMFVRRERGAYYLRRQDAHKHPDKYFSLIIDAADQSAFASPHFCNHKKQDDGHWRIAQSLMGALVHGVQAFGFTFQQNIKHGSNITVEALHRVVVWLWENKAQRGIFKQSVMYLQLDNTSKQCKSKYVLGYLALLVAWRVFKEIIVSFLLVGHTHEDIDQLFSRVAQYLRKHNALSRRGFRQAIIDAFRGKWTNKTTTGDIERAGNLSEWLEPHLADMSQKNNGPVKRTGISHWHSFRFSMLNGDTPIMQVKEWCHTDEQWRGLDEHSDHHVVFKGAIPTPADLKNECPPAQRSEVPVDPKTRKGVEALITNRKIPTEHADDLRAVLDLLESSDPLPFDWDMGVYEAHYNRGDEEEEEVKDAPAAVPDEKVQESEDNEATSSSSSESDEDLAPDNAGFVPPRLTIGAVYLLRLGTDYDTNWGLARYTS